MILREIKNTVANNVYNSLLVIAYLRKSSRLPVGRQGLSIYDLFAKFNTN